MVFVQGTLDLWSYIMPIDTLFPKRNATFGEECRSVNFGSSIIKLCIKGGTPKTVHLRYIFTAKNNIFALHLIFKLAFGHTDIGINCLGG